MEWFFGGWEGVIRVIVIAISAYLAYAIILRISGKRTLSKMNTFDLILSIAIGSLLGRTILAKDVALIESIAAIATLIAMQILFTWASTRNETIRDLVHPKPVLLFYHGQFLDAQMKRERVAREDIREATRIRGIASLDDVDAVVIEGDGKFAVIKKSGSGEEDALGTMVDDQNREKMDTKRRV
jgi:uncharacterized membrane protein YcaP (DUF421 family)